MKNDDYMLVVGLGRGGLGACCVGGKYVGWGPGQLEHWVEAPVDN
jgi:hypothetical protein